MYHWTMPARPQCPLKCPFLAISFSETIEIVLVLRPTISYPTEPWLLLEGNDYHHFTYHWHHFQNTSILLLCAWGLFLVETKLAEWKWQEIDTTWEQCSTNNSWKPDINTTPSPTGGIILRLESYTGSQSSKLPAVTTITIHISYQLSPLPYHIVLFLSLYWNLCLRVCFWADLDYILCIKIRHLSTRGR